MRSCRARPCSSRLSRLGAASSTAIDVRAIGLAVVELGGGRARAADAIDHAVGLDDLAPLGAEVGPDRPLARIHARTPQAAEAAARRLRAAYRLGEAAPAAADPVVERIAPAP